MRLVFPFLQKAFNALGFRDRADIAGLAFIGGSGFVGTQPQQPYPFFFLVELNSSVPDSRNAFLFLSVLLFSLRPASACPSPCIGIQREIVEITTPPFYFVNHSMPAYFLPYTPSRLSLPHLFLRWFLCHQRRGAP